MYQLKKKKQISDEYLVYTQVPIQSSNEPIV